MSIKTIKTIRNIFIILIGLVMFLGSQVVPATKTGETATFLEAIFMAVIPMLLHFVLWSDYLYNNIRDSGGNIGYNPYQKIGLLIVVLTLSLVVTAYYRGFSSLL